MHLFELAIAEDEFYYLRCRFRTQLLEIVGEDEEDDCEFEPNSRFSKYILSLHFQLL